MTFDVIVVGAGHAGTEAALAAARVGATVAVVTMRPDRIAHMPCNCSIGGPAKGHLVREIDALGGAMGRVTDCTMTHVRWVGTGKGPAIRTLRAHADKERYPAAMGALLGATPGITLVAAETVGIDPRPDGIRVRLATGEPLLARSVVVTAGTFLNGLMHRGEEQTRGGRLGEPPAPSLAAALAGLGLEMGRFKTGTTPRIHARSVDWSLVETVPAETCPPFSFGTAVATPLRPLLPCWLTRTTDATRDTILDSLHLSAMYAGRIEGVGPRYCPSIEDKMVRFPDRSAHPVFLEQETWDGPSLYVQGTSTSLPTEVQLAYLRTIPGLSDVELLQAGYAVEYDVVLPHQLRRTLACRSVPGLYFAGQINGTSGYEEAAAQGLLAGANAALHALGREPLVIGRDAGYIGVMVDDLVTRGVTDPYRLLTSRAEFRLLLRHDNADLRLAAVGHAAGLVDAAGMAAVSAKVDALAREADRLGTTYATPVDNEWLADAGSAEVESRCSLLDLLRRPELGYDDLVGRWPGAEKLPDDWAGTLEAETKYAGYIARQRAQVDAMARFEGMEIPADLDVSDCRGISLEGREKLARVRPATVGQAGRIPGLTPADIQSLAVLVHRHAMSAAAT